MISQLSADTFKARVRDAFSKHAGSYDNHARLQDHAAELTSQLLVQLKDKSFIPDGAVLEIGCGTGLFTNRFAKILPERTIVCSDISSKMVETCQKRMAIHNNLEYCTLDAEELATDTQYALIASSFALQWFYNPVDGISRLISALKPGGLLLFSVPGDESCHEWRAASSKLGIPFTRNPLPKLTDLKDIALEKRMEFRLQDLNVEEIYSDATAMLRSFKELGAGTQRNNLEMTPVQLKSLLRELDLQSRPLKTTHQVIVGYYRRNPN